MMLSERPSGADAAEWAGRLLVFRTVQRGLGEREIPRGYWAGMGEWLNFLLAAVTLALAVHFVGSSG